jgi:hypothetical protein
MARSAIAALALCAVLISGCDAMSQKLTEYQTTKYAKERVSTVLDGLKQSRGKPTQRALTIWFNGTLAVADDHEATTTRRATPPTCSTAGQRRAG